MKIVRATSLVLVAASTLVALAAPAFAADPVLVRLVLFANDRDNNTTEVDLVTDTAGVAKGFAYVKHDTAAKTSTRSVYTLSATAKAPGAVLESQGGINALALIGAIDVNKGGAMEFSYVSNGLTKDFKTCKVELEKTDAGWQFTNVNSKQKISKAKIDTWSLGLSNLEGICN